MVSKIKNIFSRISRRKEKKRAVFSRKNGECLLCGACVGVCPVDNLTIIKERLEIGEGCVGCGDCEKICPVEAISLKEI